MTRSTPFRAAVFVLATTVAPSVLAQPRDNPIERARHHMELGQEAFGAARFEEAAEQFIDAFSASPFAAFLYNAGLAYERQGASAKAADLYRRYLDAEPSAADAAMLEIKIRALLAVSDTPSEDVESQASAMASQMKSLISVRTNPTDAKVRVLDDKGLEIAGANGPAGLTVERGIYTIEASHPDYRTVQTDISVVPGQVFMVVVEMSQGAFLGFVHVTTDVPGATVFIDERGQGQVGVTPWGGVLPAGAHKVYVEKPGFEPAEQEVQVELGGRHELEFSLSRLGYGQLLVKTNIAGAMVLVDGQLLGAAPLDERVAPGQRAVKVTADKMKDYEATVDIGGGQQTKVLVRLNPKPSRTSAWVSAGFSLAFIAGGAVSGGVALGIRNDLREAKDRGTLASDDPRMTKGFLFALGADVAFGVATVTAAMSLYYFLRDPLPPSEGKVAEPTDFERGSEPAKLSMAPIVTPTTAGLGLSYRF